MKERYCRDGDGARPWKNEINKITTDHEKEITP